MKWSQYFILSLFFLILLYLTIEANSISANKYVANLMHKAGKPNEILIKNIKIIETKSGEESHFYQSEFYRLINYQPHLFMTSDYINYQMDEKKISIENPRGTYYSNTNEGLNFQGKTGELDFIKDTMLLSKEVELFWPFKNYTLTANSVKMFNKAKNIFAEKNVKTILLSDQRKEKIVINSENAEAKMAENSLWYIGHVQGEIIKNREYEQGINFNSKKVFINLTNDKVELTGDVEINRASMKANSARGEIFMENFHKNLKYYALYDDVKLIEKYNLGGRNLVRRSFSEKLEGIASENKIILSGLPRVYQENDAIKGNEITVYENSDIVEVDDANSNILLEKVKKEPEMKGNYFGKQHRRAKGR